MAILDRDIYIRKYVMGVLSIYSEKGLTFSNMGELADSITEAVLEGDRIWQEQRLCQEMRELGGQLEEDIPQ
jgi:hypothetical protein